MTPDEAVEQARTALSVLETARTTAEWAARMERGALGILDGLVDLEPAARDVIPDEVWADVQRSAAHRAIAASARRRRTRRA